MNAAGLQKMLSELENGEDEDEARQSFKAKLYNAEDGEEEDDSEDEDEDEPLRSRSYGMRAEDEQAGDDYERRGVADRSPYFKSTIGVPGYGAPTLRQDEGGRKRSMATRGTESAKRAFRESYGRKPRKNPRLSHYGVPPRSRDTVTGR